VVAVWSWSLEFGVGVWSWIYSLEFGVWVGFTVWSLEFGVYLKFGVCSWSLVVGRNWSWVLKLEL